MNRSRAGLALALLVASCIGACRRPTPPPEAPTPKAGASQARAYTVRGQIVGLPEAGRPSSALQIRHEAIEDFEGRDGSRGMKPMTMGFPIGPGVSLDGLAVGDKVRFTLEVDWAAVPAYWLSSIEKLPPETDLDFGGAR